MFIFGALLGAKMFVQSPLGHQNLCFSTPGCQNMHHFPFRSPKVYLSYVLGAKICQSAHIGSLKMCTMLPGSHNVLNPSWGSKYSIAPCWEQNVLVSSWSLKHVLSYLRWKGSAPQSQLSPPEEEETQCENK